MIRRKFLASLGAIGASVAALPAFALNESSASALINNLVADINKVIASGKSERSMYGDFERIFQRYSDTSYIAAYAMGVDARRASSAQKRAFSDAFQGYIARKYGYSAQELARAKSFDLELSYEAGPDGRFHMSTAKVATVFGTVTLQGGLTQAGR